MQQEHEKYFKLILVSILLLFEPSTEVRFTHTKINDIGGAAFPETSRKKYLKHEAQSLHDPTIDNIDYYIGRFAESKCLSFIDSFGKHTPASSRQYPVILRRVSAYFLVQIKSIAWGPLNYGERNLTIISKAFDCPLSQFLVLNPKSGQLPNHFCFSLNLKSYWRHVKPWNCVVNVGLFTSKFEAHFDLVAKEYESVIGDNYNPFVFPNLKSPFINIFMEDAEELPSNAIERIRSLRQNSYSHVYLNCGPIFLLFTVHKKASQGIRFAPANGRVTSVELIRMCLFAASFRGDLKHNLNNFRLLTNLALPSRIENLIWRIREGRYSFEESVFGHMIQILEYCGRTKIQSTSLVERVAHGYAHIWLRIMGNYTVSGILTTCSATQDFPNLKQWNISRTPIAFHFGPYPKSLLIFPYFANDHVSHVNFLSCGKGKYGHLPFEELINAYDAWVWLSIIVSTLAVASSLKVSQDSRKQVAEIWMGTINIFLEQGDRLAETKTMRIIVGIYLLMGIVLSNGYKNTNVYNMISHRKPIPYEYFEQLMRDNFSIYTRITALDIGIPNSWNNTVLLEGLDAGCGSFHMVYHDNLMIILISEIADIMNRLWQALAETTIWLDGNTYVKSVQNFTMDKIEVRTHSKVVSNMQQMAESVHQHALQFFQEGNVTIETFANLTSVELGRIVEVDGESLRHELQGCSNVAVILPDHVCHEYFRSLKMENRENMFVGKESYSEVNWMFTLEGVLPPFLPSRIKSAHETGLWERWKPAWVTTAGMYGKGPVPANLAGNVVIIFIIWVTGQVLASLSFMCEGMCFLKAGKYIYYAISFSAGKILPLIRLCR